MDYGFKIKLAIRVHVYGAVFIKTSNKKLLERSRRDSEYPGVQDINKTIFHTNNLFVLRL